MQQDSAHSSSFRQSGRESSFVSTDETDPSAVSLIQAVSSRYFPHRVEEEEEEKQEEEQDAATTDHRDESARPVKGVDGIPLEKKQDSSRSSEATSTSIKSEKEQIAGHAVQHVTPPARHRSSVPRMMLDDEDDESESSLSRRAMATQPGAVAVGGLVSNSRQRRYDSQVVVAASTTGTTSSISHQDLSLSPEQTEFSSSMPLTADLVPEVSEEDMEARIEARVQQEIQAKLQQQQQEQQSRNNALLVSAVPIVPPESSSSPTTNNDNNDLQKKVCGLPVTARCKLVTGGILLFVLVLFAGVAIGVAVSVSQNNGDNDKREDNSSNNAKNPPPTQPRPPPPAAPTDQPTMHPSDAPTRDRLPILLQFFSVFFPEEDPEVLADPTTNQNRALSWLAYEDPARVGLGSLTTSALARQRLLQRYAAFLLFIELGLVEYDEDNNIIEEDIQLYNEDPVCEWNIELGEEIYGFFCNDIDQTIDAVWLEFVGLHGSIPTEIGLLSNLISIALSHNELTSSIPSEIGHLSGLIEFFVSGNSMTGQIPSEFGQLEELIELDISFNMFDGELPIQMSALEELEWVSLQGNALEGFLDPIFCDRPPPLLYEELIADCDGTPPLVDCTCCTTCCSPESDAEECLSFFDDE